MTTGKLLQSLFLFGCLLIIGGTPIALSIIIDSVVPVAITWGLVWFILIMRWIPRIVEWEHKTR